MTQKKNTNLDQEIRHLHPPVGRQLEVRGGGGLYSKEWEAKNSFFLANGQPLNIGGGVKHVLFSEDEPIFHEHTFHMG